MFHIIGKMCNIFKLDKFVTCTVIIKGVSTDIICGSCKVNMFILL